MLSHIFGDAPEQTRAKVLRMFALLGAVNLLVWLWAFAEFHDNALLLGTAFLAYSFGLRHAFDADHIAAIDNLTRRLMRQQQRPIAVGLFFSLGHSTVVVGLVLAIAFGTTAMQGHFAALKEFGGVIGTSASALFLFAIAAANLVVLFEVFRTYQAVKSGAQLADDDIDHVLGKGGLLSRLLRPVFGLIERSWHAYPLGLLFGLGFDTATEVGLLGISAAQAAQGLSIWTILIFPALFTAGMSLMDTTDSTVMVGAYGWGLVRPLRKLRYNMTVTLASVIVAVVIGGIEALGLIGEKLELQGPVWRLIATLGNNLGLVGYSIVAFFVLSWAAAWLLYRTRGFDGIDSAADEPLRP